MRSTALRFAVVSLAAACGGPIAGARVTLTTRPEPRPAIATATTSESGGLRVLANRRARPGPEALLASSPSELAELWPELGLYDPPPEVDFATHIVVGVNFDLGGCHGEIVAAHVGASGTLWLEEQDTAEFCLVRDFVSATVIAVPRALVGQHFTWDRDPRGEAYTFIVPPPPAPAAVAPRPAVPPLDRRSIAAPRGVVELPPPGHLALRALDDGRQVWVVHRAGGDVSVVLADRGTANTAFRTAITWRAQYRRFEEAGLERTIYVWDSRGRSVDGDEPLVTLAFARVAAGRIAIGDAAALPDGPIEPRAREPVLDGPAMPYDDVDPADFAAIPEGHVGRVADDLVTGLDGQPRLCPFPFDKLHGYLPGCPENAPAVAARLPRPNATPYVQRWEGPHIVRRRGNIFDLSIDAGNGYSGGLHERTLEPPAPHGPTRQRGTLTVNTAATGDTRGAADGFTPPCIAAEAGGGPDEVWTLVAPQTAAYAIALDSDHDGVVAAVGDDGRVLACNDDHASGKNRSVIHLPLVAGQRIRVIVDAYGGARQAYRLRAAIERPVPDGGVLAVGVPVSGDTTDTFDDHEPGCWMPDYAHAFRVVFDRPGAYTFRIETTGWHPRVAYGRDGQYCNPHEGTSPLVWTDTLDEGAYMVVVGGAEAGAHGRYTLRVDPAPARDD